MKKRLFAIFCIFALLAGMTACGKDKTPPDASQPASSPAVSAPAQSEPAEPAEPEQPATQQATVYLPDENAENLIPTEIECAKPAEGDFTAAVAALVDALVAQEALPAGSAVLSAEQGDPVRLDMNAAFGEGMMSTGTTGEILYLGALVNTVLDYTGAEHVELTVAGAPLETGHNLYDYPIGAVTP